MENTEVVAETPAPEQVATPAPEPVEAPAVKTFTQEEVDALIGKRLARERRSWERERPKAPAAPAEPVTQDKFESVEAYADALAAQKAEQLLQQRELERQQAAVVESYHEKEEQARDKYDDFEQVAYNPSLKISTVMAQTIQASEIGPDIAYFLGSNPKEADPLAHRLTTPPIRAQSKQ
jgi:hypothetical protein